jgi:hypothetical protein
MPRLATLLAVCVLALLASSGSASALPLYGYNAYQWPCWAGAYSPNECIGPTVYRWHSGSPVVYRFGVKQSLWGSDGSYYTRALQEMRSNGVEPFPILERGDLSPVDTEPERRYDWYPWVRKVGEAFRQYGVQDYEIFNEPNAKDHWGTYPGDGYNYATAYCWAVWALKETGTTARMHLGGVARGNPAISQQELVPEKRWLSLVKYYIDANCRGIAIDGVSYHPYTQNANPDYNANELENLLWTFRGYMNTVGLQGSMIMATEIGWNAPDSGSYDLQRRQLASLFERCKNLYGTQLYLRACYWFPLIDVPSQTNLPYGGLVTRYGEFKPAWYEF